MRTLTTTASKVGTNMRWISTWGTRAGLGLTAIGVAAVKSGLQFNSMMEQQTIAFRGFLGSTRAATAYLNKLYLLAARTPFRFGDVVRGTRTLMAYGASAQQAYGTIKDLGNAISAVGGGADEINRATVALGQIQAAGILHAQDLNQLVQAGVVSIPKLAMRMGMSTKSFRKEMALGQITSQRFFASLRYSWTHDPMYKGAMTRQAKSFVGQLSTLHDFTVSTLGTITKPMFNDLERNGLPRLTRFVTQVNRIWMNTQLPLADRFRLTEHALQRALGPVGQSIQQWWQRNHVTDTLNRLLDQAVAKLGQGLVTAAAVLAGSFWKAFWSVDAVGKLGVTGGALFVAKKLGLTAIFGGLGKLLRGGLGGKGGGLLGGATTTRTMVVNAGTVVVNGKGTGVLPSEKTTLGKIGSRLAPFAPLAADVGLPLLAAGIPISAAFFDTQRKRTVDATHRAIRDASGGVAFNPSAPYTRSTAVAAMPSPPIHHPTTPQANQGLTGAAHLGDVVVPITLTLDGQVLAQGTHRAALRKKATR